MGVMVWRSEQFAVKSWIVLTTISGGPDEKMKRVHNGKQSILDGLNRCRGEEFGCPW